MDGKVMKEGEYYQYHVKNYGHPSQFGYREIINLWKAENLSAGLSSQAVSVLKIC